MRFIAPGAVVEMTRTIGVAVQGREEFRASQEDWLVGYEEFA
jgi:hypothetical protein